MSDQSSDGSLPELTPDQEERVRRLLAEARHDEPIPAEVADRLDSVLAGLTRDEPGSSGLAPVIDLAARRRRRNAAAVLASAAAVIVAGFGIAQVVGGSDDKGNDAASSTANADRTPDATASGAGASSGASAFGSESSPSSASSASEDQLPQAAAPSSPLPMPLVLTSRHLAEELTTQLGGQQDAAKAPLLSDLRQAKAFGCVVPDPPPAAFGAGTLYAAMFDRQPAVLALRPASGGLQEADVLTCDTATLLASATIPVP